MNPVCLKSKNSDLSTWKGSISHCEAVETLVLLPSQIQGGIGEMFGNKCNGEKKANREMLMQILQNVRFLARQGSPLRGSSNDNLTKRVTSCNSCICTTLKKCRSMVKQENQQIYFA